MPRPTIETLEPRRLLAAGDFTGDFAATINFQPEDLGPVENTRADFGRPFAVRGNGLTYGWNRDIEPVDVDSTRDLPGLTVGGNIGNGPEGEDQNVDERYDTHVPVNPGDSFSIEVPEGNTYAISFVSGSPDFDGPYGAARHDWLVNGQRVMNAQVTPDYPWGENVLYVEPVDGRITLTAGENSQQNSLAFLRVASVEPLEEAGEGVDVSWTNDTGLNSPIRRVEGNGITVGDRLYMVGGFTEGYQDVTNRLDIYDFNTGEFTRGADLPDLVAETHAAAATDGRYIYSISGQLGLGSGTEHPGTTAVHRYDTQTDSWERFPADLPEIRHGGAATVLDGFLYMFGGDDETWVMARGDAWRIDLADPDADWQPLATMPFAVDHIEAQAIDGKIYVPGGEYAHSISYVQRAELQIYDPATDSWSLGQALPVPTSHGRTFSLDGRLWYVGGQRENQIVLPQTLSYDPAEDEWSRHDDMPQPRRVGYVALRDRTVFYFAGDSGNGFPASTLVGEVDRFISVDV